MLEELSLKREGESCSLPWREARRMNKKLANNINVNQISGTPLPLFRILKWRIFSVFIVRYTIIGEQLC
jgi:hypothetical protein